jgi:hypothetical protein
VNPVEFLARISGCPARIAASRKPWDRGTARTCRGGVVEIALACDVVVAAEDAVISDGHRWPGGVAVASTSAAGRCAHRQRLCSRCRAFVKAAGPRNGLHAVGGGRWEVGGAGEAVLRMTDRGLFGDDRGRGGSFPSTVISADRGSAAPPSTPRSSWAKRGLSGGQQGSERAQSGHQHDHLRLEKGLLTRGFVVERVRGIEPPLSPWEAAYGLVGLTRDWAGRGRVARLACE